MNYFDHPHPFVTESLSCDGVSRYSVGYYRGRRRVIFAWFLKLEDADLFADRARARFPLYRIDVLKSLF